MNTIYLDEEAIERIAEAVVKRLPTAGPKQVKPYLSFKEVQDEVGIGREKLRELIDAGLPVLNIGEKSQRIEYAELQRFLRRYY